MEKTILSKLGGRGSVKCLAAAAAAGLLLFLLGGTLFGGGEGKEQGAEDVAHDSIRFYTEELEKRIEAICLEVHGVKEAHVLLTLEGGSEYVYSANTSAARSTLFTAGKSGESPVLVQEICPKIRGVAIVCTRGDDSAVQLTITELLSAALGISAANIRVAGT